MYLVHPAKEFQFADIKIHPRAHRSQHGIAHTRAAVHLETHLHQVLDDLLNLFLAGRLLHGDDQSFTSDSNSVSPPVDGRSGAISSFWILRMMSMMRS